MRTSVGWVGWGAKVTSPTQTSLGSSSHRGFTSHVLLAASTHSRTSQPQHAPPTGLGGFARRRAALTPAPALGHQPVCLWVGRCHASPAVRVRCAAGPSSVWAVLDPTGAPSSPRELRRPLMTASEASARRCAPITASRALFGPHPNCAPSVSHLKWHRTQEYSQTLKCYKPEMRGSLRRAVDAGGASELAL